MLIHTMSSTRFDNSPNFATHNLCGLNLSMIKNKQNSSDDAKYLSLKSALKDMDYVCFSETKTPDTSFDYKYFFLLGRNSDKQHILVVVNRTVFLYYSIPTLLFIIAL